MLGDQIASMVMKDEAQSYDPNEEYAINMNIKLMNIKHLNRF